MGAKVGRKMSIPTFGFVVLVAHKIFKVALHSSLHCEKIENK